MGNRSHLDLTNLALVRQSMKGKETRRGQVGAVGPEVVAEMMSREARRRRLTAPALDQLAMDLASVAEAVRVSREAPLLPPNVTDPAALARIAELLKPS